MPTKQDIAPLLHLFWDVRTDALDPTQHAKLIITQVFNYGSLDEIRHIKKIYPREMIADAFSHPIRGVWDGALYRAFIHWYPEALYDASAVNRSMSSNFRKKTALV